MTTFGPTLFGLMGKKRSGKDTFASVLVEEGGFQRVAFADPLKEAAYSLDPLVGPASLPGDLVPSYHYLSEVVDALGWETAKDVVPGVRRTLQRLGVAIREQRPSFWLDLALERITAAESGVVVTDVRFPNEADAIRALGGKLVRVVRPSVISTDEHPSETALDDYPADVLIHNVADLDALQGFARHLLQPTIF